MSRSRHDLHVPCAGRDDANRLTSETNPAGGTTAYAYDDNGELVRTTNPVGAVTTNV